LDDETAVVLFEPLGTDNAAVGPVDLNNMRQPLRAVRKMWTAMEMNVFIDNWLAWASADERDGNAMARGAVRRNATAIAIAARVATIIMAARFAVSDLRMAGLRRRCWRSNGRLLRRRDGLPRVSGLPGLRLRLRLRLRSGRWIGRAVTAVHIPAVFDKFRLCDPVPAQLPALFVTATIGSRIAAIAFVMKNGYGFDF
jgi:hypothetical protein